MTVFVRNTYFDDPNLQWTAWPTREAACTAAQELIDAGGARWMWVEDDLQIYWVWTCKDDGPTMPPWMVDIYDSLEEAMDMVTYLPSVTWPAHRAAILSAASGKEPDPPKPPRRRRKRA